MKIYHRFTRELLLEYQGDTLQGANLRGANLIGADLRGADLRRANLRRADLRRSNLQDADLRGADLRGADILCASLQRANLQDADIQYAYVAWANLQGADLTDADLTGASLWDTIGNGREVKRFQFPKWSVVVWKDVVQIGCRMYTLKEWLSFDDDKIASMDKHALSWWKEHKDQVVGFVESNGP